MIRFPSIDPTAISIGPLKLRWYGLMYLIGFALAWLLAVYRAGRSGSGWRKAEISDLITACAVGVIAGARLGYVLFYDFSGFISSPWKAFMIWQGGMSFHGGMLGVMAALLWYSRKTRRTFFQVSDFVAPLAPLGLLFGRLGNFINAELWGRPTSLPWGMIFPDPAAGGIPRHPSQLYQAFFEGLVLFVILWFFSSRPRPEKTVSGLFCLGYGVFRFGAEFFREPDAHLGFVLLNWMTMGQVLSTPLIIIGIALLIHSGYKQKTESGTQN
ncbi:MAG: prolipoprotein diacylglyceryl transferase [Desulfonatronovibrionaceae bacterium]